MKIRGGKFLQIQIRKISRFHPYESIPTAARPSPSSTNETGLRSVVHRLPFLFFSRSPPHPRRGALSRCATGRSPPPPYARCTGAASSIPLPGLRRVLLQVFVGPVAGGDEHPAASSRYAHPFSSLPAVRVPNRGFELTLDLGICIRI